LIWIQSVGTVLLIAALLLLPGAMPAWPWRRYEIDARRFVPSLQRCVPPPISGRCAPRTSLPADWNVGAAALADITGDGALECALLVWRPWRDWPIQRWHSARSPIAEFRDAAGDSCHVILLDPATGREIWAGSALPAPFTALAAGDIDGDGQAELVVLEGDYAAGRRGVAGHVDIWRWAGFGFRLQHRSPPGIFHQLCLTDDMGGGILSVYVR
jgi:hypothetical protein